MDHLDDLGAKDLCGLADEGMRRGGDGLGDGVVCVHFGDARSSGDGYKLLDRRGRKHSIAGEHLGDVMTDAGKDRRWVMSSSR